jgi:hypothetical protein
MTATIDQPAIEIVDDGTRRAFLAPGLERLDLIDVDVREGRQVFPSASVADALSFKTVLSRKWALERLEPQMAVALDGDGS